MNQGFHPNHPPLSRPSTPAEPSAEDPNSQEGEQEDSETSGLLAPGPSGANGYGATGGRETMEERRERMRYGCCIFSRQKVAQCLQIN